MAHEQLSELVSVAERILVFTGAGISTGSGIKDFRGPQGVWKTRSPVYFDDFMSSETSRIEHWDQKLESWPSFQKAKPNQTHDAIVRLEDAGKLELLLTQNIDGLHERAGTTKPRLVEIHGTNTKVECMNCHELSLPDAHMVAFAETRTPPLCSCGGYLKPATISFGQSLRAPDMQRAADGAAACDLVIALGSTLSVYPAASFPVRACERGVPYVVINRGETDHDGLPGLTLRLEGDVAELFPPAVAAALAERG